MKRKFFSSAPLWLDGLFIIRIFSAIMIIPYGLELFEPAKMTDLVNFLSSTSLPFPKILAYLAKITEFFGGILLGIGLFTRLVTIPLTISMFGVVYTMGGGSIFVDQTAFLFLLLFAGFFLAGPGKWSLDYLIFDRKHTKS